MIDKFIEIVIGSHTYLKIIGIDKVAFRKLIKILRDRKYSLETKKIVLNGYVIFVLIYDIVIWTLTSKIRKRLKYQRCCS